ncbi:MAG: sensor histidine kinase [Acidimicrobiales bacterium]
MRVEEVALCADRAQLAEVLANLVSNAYEAMGARGSLELAAFEAKESVCIVVADDGPGIDRSITERVLEPFFTTRQRGTGLGLAIARRLVEAHGGAVRVQSEPQAGTRFMLRLPKAPLTTTVDTQSREATGDATACDVPLQPTARQ